MQLFVNIYQGHGQLELMEHFMHIKKGNGILNVNDLGVRIEWNGFTMFITIQGNVNVTTT